MSEDLFYDRTRNISGVSLIGADEYTPSYGSSVAFSSKNMKFETHNNYYQSIPMGVNNLAAKFNLVYKTNEDGAKKLANYYESSEGVDLLEVNTDPSIYKAVSGYCTNYSINHINKQNYEVKTTIEVVDAPGLLNWRSMNFLNYNLEEWEETKEYKKHDIVYRDVYDLKLNNFYYCKEDHVSSLANAPEQAESSWTQDFFWEPDLGTNTQVDLGAVRYEGGISVFNKIKKNTATFPINYVFSNISDKQLRAMLHFLENKCGYRRFKHKIPSVYNRPKVFICPSWNHTFVYSDNHNLQVNFEEDPIGILPKKHLI
jgi:phage-related protein